MRLRTRLGIAVVATGVGLGVAPAANAATAPADREAKLVTKSGTRTLAPVTSIQKTRNRSGGVPAAKGSKAARTGQAVEAGQAVRAVRCWDGWRRGRTFHEKCTGTRYRPYVDCSNGYRYIFRTYSGTREFWLYCPSGTRAIWGGAYG